MDTATFWFQGGTADGPNPNLIGNSLRFRGAQALRLDPPNNNITAYTFSAWVKRSKLGSDQMIWSVAGGGPINWVYYLADDTIRLIENDSVTRWEQITNAKYRDPSAWMHIVLAVDTTLAVAGDRVKAYINGELLTSLSTRVDAPQNWVLRASTGAHGLGYSVGYGNKYLDGYLAEAHFVADTAHGPETFGEYDANGVWVPKIVGDIDYGTNGFYLDFSDPDDIGADRSGNGNNFTATGFELTNIGSRYLPYDWVADSPTNNYSTYNPLDLPTGNIGSANLTHGQPAASYGNARNGFRIPSSGKWALEVQTSGMGSSGTSHWGFAMEGSAYNTATNFNYAATSTGNANPANLSINGTGVGQHTFTSVFRLEVDMDASPPSVETFRGGTSINTQDWTDYDGTSDVYFYTRAVNGSSFAINYGQQPLTNAASAGFQPLSTAELPNVAIRNPSEHFQTILSGSDPRPNPPQIGDERAGGYFAGYKLSDDGTQVNELIVAPVSEGSLNGRRQGNFSNKATNTNIPNADNLNTGRFATSAYGDDSGWFAWHWCKNDTTGPNAGNYDTTNTAGTGIGGFNDWYIPAINEMQMIYRAFKPTTANNNTSWGAVGVAVPPTNNYTSTDPGQTSVALFQEGAAQALPTDAVFGTSSRYTDGSFTPGTWAIRWNNMADGNIFWNGGYTLTNSYQLAVRLGDGYPAEILEAAQRTFPNGLWWIKDRDNSNQHQLVDSVRGGNLALQMPSQNPETAYTAPAGNSVAWCWNVTQAASANTDGSIPSQVAANQAVGFSIATWSGTQADGTVGHGLSQAPEFMILRRRNSVASTPVYHSAISPANYLWLNESGAQQSSGNAWGSTPTAPTDSVFTVGDKGDTNYGDMIVYCWHSVPGYSAFGSYVGNGNEDGPFCFTGHRPAFLLIKWTGGGGSTAEDWMLYDVQRNTYNPANLVLQPSATQQEEAPADRMIDVLSNGFKLRAGGQQINRSGANYIYAAFAEHPFGGSNVFPTTAR